MPIRTCLVTGQKLEQSCMCRFTIVKGGIVFDEDTKNSGRGGYVVNEPQAIEKLPKLKKKIAHFMKTNLV